MSTQELSTAAAHELTLPVDDRSATPAPGRLRRLFRVAIDVGRGQSLITLVDQAVVSGTTHVSVYGVVWQNEASETGPESSEAVDDEQDAPAPLGETT